ncbi:MAG: hypothetical protein WBL95_13900 [Microcoleus sp.]
MQIVDTVSGMVRRCQKSDFSCRLSRRYRVWCVAVRKAILVADCRWRRTLRYLQFPIGYYCFLALTYLVRSRTRMPLIEA